MTKEVTHLRVIHASGQRLVPPREAADYFLRLFTTKRAHLMTTTECGKYSLHGKRDVLKEIRENKPKYIKVRRRGEYLFLWDSRYIKGPRLRPRAYRLSHQYPRATAWRDWQIARMPFKVNGHKMLAEASHAPSGVQNGTKWRWANHTAVNAYKGGLSLWGSLGRNTMVPRVVGMDTNLDMKEEVWRYVLSEHLPHTAYPKSFLNLRSHGDRLIDMIFSDLTFDLFDRTYDTNKPEAMDHAPVLATLRVAPPRKRN